MNCCETADKYVRATVLFVIAIAQRLKSRHVRLGANVIAGGLLVYALLSVVSLPRM